jgi:squalene-hopene/tetraprenyl-beta-curcumene cyclase
MITIALLLSALAAPQDVDRARAAVERSLPYLEKEGVAWIEKRDCLSCHVVPFLVWSHDEARAKGIPVDLQKLAGWVDWSTKESEACRMLTWLSGPILDDLKAEGLPADTVGKLTPFTTRPELKGGKKETVFRKELANALTAEERSKYELLVLRHAAHGKGDGGGVDTMSQLLLAGVGGAEFAASTRAFLLGFQQPDGSWKPNGQLRGMNRSEGEAVAITTMWTALALGPSSDAAQKAVGFVRKAARGKTTEWLVVRALGEAAFGERGAAEEFLRELRGRQNADGGWSAVPEAASDAFATGLALYALGSAEDAAVPRARKFLAESQSPDGSWAVPPAPWTTAGSKPERNQRLDPIYRYWGSAWAAIGLARTLP